MIARAKAVRREVEHGCSKFSTKRTIVLAVAANVETELPSRPIRMVELLRLIFTILAKAAVDHLATTCMLMGRERVGRGRALRSMLQQ